MTDRRPNPPVEEPRSEPEIIPPGADPRPPPVPFSLILVILIVGLMSAALLVLMIGTLLMMLPASCCWRPLRSSSGCCGCISGVSRACRVN